MRVWRIVSVISLLILSSGYYYRDELLKYREVRVALTRAYRLMDSLFNELYEAEDSLEEEDMFEYLVDNIEPIDENGDNSTDSPSCYSWDSLNYLADEVHHRIVNCSIALHGDSHRVENDLRQSIKSVELTTESFESKLAWFNDHVDKEVIAPTAQQFFSILQKSLENIENVQRTLTNLIIQIDEDHLRMQKVIIVRLAQVQKHFQRVIDVHQSAQLECTCDVLQILDDVTKNYSAGVDDCTDPVIDQIRAVAESLQASIKATLTYVQRITEPGIDSKESIYDVQYQMPSQVRILPICNVHKCSKFANLIRINSAFSSHRLVCCWIWWKSIYRTI